MAGVLLLGAAAAGISAWASATLYKSAVPSNMQAPRPTPRCALYTNPIDVSASRAMPRAHRAHYFRDRERCYAFDGKLMSQLASMAYESKRVAEGHVRMIPALVCEWLVPEIGQ